MKSRKRTEWTNDEMAIIQHIKHVDDNLIFADLPGVYGCYYYNPKDYKVPSKRRLKDSVGTVNSKRVASCKAWIMEIGNYIYIISYNTVIGCFDGRNGVYYSTGAYSSTTYQHERKALDMLHYTYGIKPVKYVNLWLVDNFA